MKRHFYYILVSLAAADRHGSGIVRDILELTDGDLRLWPATLYGSLGELEEVGWIRELADAPSAAEAVGHRRWFAITAAGRRALSAEVARLQGMIATAKQRLSVPRGGA